MGKKQRLTDDPGFGPGCLMLQAMGMVAIVAILVIFVRTPKRMKWMDIPAYPNIAQVISRDDQPENHRIEFTTTGSVSQTLAWYDATFTANGWKTIKPFDADRSYMYFRTSSCTIFYIDLTLAGSGRYIQNAHLELPKHCDPRNQ